VLDFTYILGVVFYNRGDRAPKLESRIYKSALSGSLTFIPIESSLVRFFP